ncbi:Xaa-Pro peptidase family protein [Tamlana sp. 2201CG12-4]|uniref:M24 family metallopeptidase n=1 Tax=Tamlana sp. 2201CG12-4 TaxID=3112582 RepID=UPI002DBF9AA6|nr:Xaa-Pro peptidase family protein [Tamlana sp. 2201CG12-4]MEC3906717.1 Xaa-Pro peptidase family protein [Tamlana sp. 2201CG12-4]
MRTVGIGGSTIEAELSRIIPTAHLVKPIPKAEFQSRIEKACSLMKTKGVQVLYLHSGTNLYYFTGMRWNPSERLVGALVFPNGKLHYIAPKFEEGTILDFMSVEGQVHCWEEHESPYELLTEILKNNHITEGEIFIDETAPFFISDGILKAPSAYTLSNARPVISVCRMIKSDTEIAIIKHVMNITLDVQKAAARILRVGISAREVIDFINEAHKRYGITSDSYFCIVLFGVDSSFPHGVSKPKNLEMNDMVLIDTGCVLYDYISDITRTYVFGEANNLQRSIWNIEKETQQAAFNAAQVGNTCASVDLASRKVLESNGLGPDYKLPGLPHRTGHGIGLDIHEYPYMVKGNDTVLKPGMCFSNEPMICVPNKFGVRLEDHIYITAEGPKWFTESSNTIENPFGVFLKS